MKKNFFKGAALAALVFAGVTATAQEESKGIELSGSVDTYFRANFNADQDVAPKTSFANQPGFALGMANLIASKQVGKVGVVADLVFGQRGIDAVDGSGSNNIVNQLFVTYDVSDAVTLTFGNFNTFLGYEVISPTGNFNYSTSYMFSNGPFSHSGLKADFAIDDNWSIMAAILNSTDETVSNFKGNYAGGLQIGYSQDNGSAYLNVLYGGDPQFDEITEDFTGSNDIFQIDLTTGWDLSDEFYLGLNTTYNNNTDTEGGFYGVALYPQYALSDSFSLGARGEYFAFYADGSDDDDAVAAATLTGSYTKGNLTIKPEFRAEFDKEGTPTNKFTNGDDVEDNLEDNLFSFVLGAIYSF